MKKNLPLFLIAMFVVCLFSPPKSAAQYEPSVTFANALTREVNVKQIRDRLPKLSTIETRLKDMDRMGIDMQAVSPAPNQCYYWTDPELGAELSRMVNDRLAEIVATWPERFVALGTVPLQPIWRMPWSQKSATP